MQILIGLIAISVIMFVHECGHFIAARAFGIKVREFAIFMGPRLLSFKKGETVYSLRSIPIGAFVKMEGEEEDSADEHAFCNQPLWQRAVVAFAGSFANIVVAFIIFFSLSLASGYVTTTIASVDDSSGAYEAGLREGDVIMTYNETRIRHALDMNVLMFISGSEPVNVTYERDGRLREAAFDPIVYEESHRHLIGFIPKASSGPDSNVVESVHANSDAHRAGLMPNDRIVSIDEMEISSRADIAQAMENATGDPMTVTVERDGQTVDLSITPYEEYMPLTVLPGFYFAYEQGGFFQTLANAWSFTFANVRSVYRSLGWLISGRVSMQEVMGPVGIISTIGSEAVRQPSIWIALQSLINLIAIISVNLGVMNLLPIPALDGSKLIIFGIEGIRRKPLPQEKEALVTMIGFVLLITLMIVTLYNDIMRLVLG